MFIDLEQTFEQNRNHIMKETHRSELCIKAQKERKKKSPESTESPQRRVL